MTFSRRRSHIDVCEYPDSEKINILPAMDIFQEGSKVPYDVVKKKRHQVKQHSIQVLFYIKKALAKILYFVISFMPDRGIRQCWEAT